VSQQWVTQKNIACNAIGDCGSKANYIGKITTGGFSVVEKKVGK